MQKNFHKTANRKAVPLAHPGIIDASDFASHFDLRCYESAEDLQPFVVHIWTQRLKKPLDASTPLPVEVASGPHVYAFFTSGGSFVQLATQGFAYDPRTADIIAGIKFRPGGFYPFLQRSVATLGADILPIQSVFPHADTAFCEALLAQKDEKIVNAIEHMLRQARPSVNSQMAQVGRVMNRLDQDASLSTARAVARAFDMSERSLQLLFQTHVGVGIKWILTRKRLLSAISHAQADPTRSWVEVAAELGYSSQSHFSREFKRVIGQSPTQYARRIRI